MGLGGTIGWLVGLIFGSLLLGWLVKQANWNLLPVILWHGTFNFFSASDKIDYLYPTIISTLVIIVSIWIGLKYGKDLSSKSLQNMKSETKSELKSESDAPPARVKPERKTQVKKKIQEKKPRGKAKKEELKKDSWTTKEELKFSNQMVVATTFLFGLGIYVVDLIIKGFLDGIALIVHFIFG
jgi:preprotein translocase subunit SecE